MSWFNTKTNHRVLKLGLLMVVLAMVWFGLKLGASDTKAAFGINQQINYQGKLNTASGAAVADGTYNIKFVIYNASSGGSCLWTASGACDTTDYKAVSVTTVNGVFSIALGDTGQNSIATSTINFNDDSLYLGVTVESDLEMTPRKRITSSVYAFNADAVDGLHATSTEALANYLVALDVDKVLNLYDGSVSSTRATSTELFSTYATTTGSTYLGTSVGLNDVYINNWSDLNTIIGAGSNIFDQWLDTTSSVQFLNATTTGSGYFGTLGLNNEYINSWSDLTSLPSSDIFTLTNWFATTTWAGGHDLTVNSNATTSGHLIVGTTNPIWDLGVGDAYFGGNSTTTGSTYLGTTTGLNNVYLSNWTDLNSTLSFLAQSDYYATTTWAGGNNDLVITGSATTTGSGYFGTLGLNNEYISSWADLTSLPSSDIFTLTSWYATTTWAGGHDLTVAGNATTSGHLVVGTTNPLGFEMGTGDLYVGGNATTTGNLTVTGDLFTVLNGNATTSGNFTANNTLYVKDNNVGIGTMNPSSLLHLSKETTPATQTNFITATHNASYQFNLIADNQTTDILWKFGTVNSGVSYPDTLVLDNGNVGIGGNATTSGHLIVGTTNPTWDLGVGDAYFGGNSTTTGSTYLGTTAGLNNVYLSNWTDLNNTLSFLAQSDYYATTTWAGGNNNFNVTGNTILTGNATTTGYLVVGTTNPTWDLLPGDLYASGNGTTTGHFAASGGNSDQWNTAFANTVTNNLYLLNSDYYATTTWAGGNNDLLVTGNSTTTGHLIIGTTNPTWDLGVGDAYFGGNATTSGHLAASGGNSDQWNTAFANTVTNNLYLLNSDYYATTTWAGGNNNLTVTGNATTTGYLVVGTTNPTWNLSAGDLYVGGSASTTGSLYVGAEALIASTNKLSFSGQGLEYINSPQAGDITLQVRNNLNLNFDSDGNTAGTLTINALGSPRLTMLNTGYVGIGVTTPTSTLSVNGSFAIWGTGTNDVFAIDTSGNASTTGNWVVNGNATTTGHLVIGSTEPTWNMSTGDLYVGGSATTTNLAVTGDTFTLLNGNATTSGHFVIGTTIPAFEQSAGDLYVGGSATTTNLSVTGDTFTLLNGNATTSGRLIVGTTIPTVELGVGDIFAGDSLTVGANPDITNYGAFITRYNTNAVANNYGVYASSTNFQGTNSYGVYGRGLGANSYGVYGEGRDGQTNNYGVYGAAIASGTTSYNYGVYGSATAGALTKDNYAGYFSGNTYLGGDSTTTGKLVVGTTNPTWDMAAGDLYVGGAATTTGKLTVGAPESLTDNDAALNVGYISGGPSLSNMAVYATSTYTGSTVFATSYGVYSTANNDYNNILTSAIGVYGGAKGGGALTSYYGVYGAATGSGINYALYGFANGGATNYGVYSSGDAYISGKATTTGKMVIGPLAQAEGDYSLELPLTATGQTGYGRSYGWSSVSDSRLKTNQQILNYGLAELMKLGPKRYIQHGGYMDKNNQPVFTDEGADTIGLIAQEVYGIIPEAVQKPGSEAGIWGIDYNRLTPVIIKSIQELAAKVDQALALSSKVDELTAKVDALTNSDNKSIIDELTAKINTLASGLSNSTPAADTPAPPASTDTSDTAYGHSAELSNNLIVRQQSDFYGLLTAWDISKFMKKVVFNDNVYFNRDTAGILEIKAGATSTEILFEKDYEWEPIITLTPRADIKGTNYWIESETVKGFRVAVDPVLEADVKFNWHAMAVDGFGNIIVSQPDDSIIAGCTNNTAANYNPTATQDDGSCQMAQTQNPPQNSGDGNSTEPPAQTPPAPVAQTPVEPPVVETPVESAPVVETPVPPAPVVETPAETPPIVETPAPPTDNQVSQNPNADTGAGGGEVLP